MSKKITDVLTLVKKSDDKIDKISTFLDDIIKVYPKIKDDKQLILNKLTAKNIFNVSNTPNFEYILDKIVLPEGDYKQDDFNILTDNTRIYYIDPFNNILNAENELVGILNRSCVGGKYLFFKTKCILPDVLHIK